MTIENNENKAISWASRSATWALTFGIVGFLSGFIGPMIFNPSANQGPMLGIFITGPAAFVVGGLFGAISAFNKLSTRHNLYALIVCSVFVTGFLINVSVPEPRTLGFVVDAEIRDCKFAESALATFFFAAKADPTGSIIGPTTHLPAMVHVWEL